jgi:hypothetical protein
MPRLRKGTQPPPAKDTIKSEATVDTRFQFGNPGRPIGSRNKLCEAFLKDLQSIWSERGSTVLRMVAEEYPAQLMNAVASLVPKQVEIDIEQALYVIRDNPLSATEWDAQYTTDKKTIETNPPKGMH